LCRRQPSRALDETSDPAVVQRVLGHRHAIAMSDTQFRQRNQTETSSNPAA
jgi:hypothetical protein